MQIQLVQTEIEQALRNYINGLINIKEGTQINIDLSAGRGADGFKATIDIVALADQAQTAVKAETKPADEKPVTKAEPKVEKQAAKAEAKTAEQTQASADVKPETKPEVKPETQTETGAVAGSATVAGDDVATTEQPAVEPVQAEEGEAQTEGAEKAPRKSLFGGLTKPVNE